MKTMLLFILLFGLMACTQEQEKTKPNVVIIFLDDSGWADFEPFGELAIETPSVKLLAEEGSSFHNFYVPQAVCSASRSALLTGCFPGRTGVFGAHGPNAWGLDTAFATMGEVFSDAGYVTAAFGKWHCGDQPETRSHARGFDETCGLMYSNDMWKHHPGNPEYWGQWPLHYWENGEVTIEEVDHEHQKNLTRWYTEHAVDFIRRHQDSAFFLYVPHSMPHVPLYTSKDFEDKSCKGIYWDVILEIDWSVGEINRTLKECGIDQNTMVILTSDNGPWVSYGDHAGLTPFREAKGTSFDGGIRSACIMKYPGKIPSGIVSTKTLGTVNLLPTLCQMAEIPLPDNAIDGVSVWDLVQDLVGAENEQPYYAFSNGSHFEGVMSGNGRWKLHLPHAYRSLLEAGADGNPGIYEMFNIDTALFDMDADPFETTDVRDQYPDVASDLIKIAEKHKAQFYSN